MSLTLRDANNSSIVTLSPENGSIVTSVRMDTGDNGKREILFYGKDPSGKERGGIPLLFPQSGPLTDKEKTQSGYTLPQHGFGRTMPWIVTESRTDSVMTELVSNEMTRAMFPYDFRAQYRVTAIASGISLILTVTNTGTSPLPLAFWLHPYFAVSSDERTGIGFDFAGGNEVARRSGEWLNGDFISLPAPMADTPMNIHLPHTDRAIRLTISEVFTRLWVWSMTGGNWVCVEPVMRDVGGLVNDPYMVAVGERVTGAMTIGLVEKGSCGIL